MAKQVSLTDKFRDVFTPEMRELGERNWLVDPVGTGPHFFSADVSLGDECWLTELEVYGRRLLGECDCPEGLAGRVCGHLWTLLRKAEEFGDLGLATKRSVSGKVIECPTEADDEDDEDEDEWGDEYDDGDEGWEEDEEADASPIMGLSIADLEKDILELRGAFDYRPPEEPKDDRPERPDIHCLIEPAPFPRGRKAVVRLYWSERGKPAAWDSRHIYDPSPMGSWGEPDYLAMLRPFRHKIWSWEGGFYFEIEGGVARVALRKMALTERTVLRTGDDEPVPLRWQEGSAWRFVPTLDAAGDGYRASGRFEGAERTVELTEARLLVDRVVLTPGLAFEAETGKGARHLHELHEAGGERWLSEAEAREWVLRLRLECGWPLAGLPPELLPPVREERPRTQLHVRTAKFKYRGKEQLHLELSFLYDSVAVSAKTAGELVRSGRQLLVRDRTEEAAGGELLRLLGCRYNTNAAKEEPGWKLSPAELDRVVWELVEREWLVTAEGKTYRKPQEKSLTISSGTDWLEVRGGIDFGEGTVPFPKLLAAAKRGASAVRLDDGTYGLLPREWLERYTVLTELGEVEGDAIRFRLAQGALLDALLRERGEEAAAALAEVRGAWKDFAGTGPADPPEGFVGTLRDYQRIGLGWLRGLRELGLGGCLADDMGLGKTIQVLALLAERAGVDSAPSLVVAPRSLLFNWEAEAARFAPGLRVCSHHGAGRAREVGDFTGADVFLTTYGTLRQDVELLAQVPFDLVVLDESQAIKNADTTTAKCARALRARQRLVMTGTPVENRIEDLFSQFSFLNPGLFGSGALASRLEAADAMAIGKALRPLILRRTKTQVAKELPPKTEKTLFCELGEEQRREYDQLRDFYRQELGKEGKGRFDVLAALLRLRQTACHAALVSPAGEQIPSAKLDLLFAELATLREEGRKTLVFSQFTRLLRLVEGELKTQGVGYCYLDGKTKDRREIVRRFQEEADLGVFLISLKAGGVGLNLTAADTVFLLDPWWNPAAESQAIDRLYRIGQDQPVFAYRLIARDTVEEKVLALQERKRALAAAVVGSEEGFAAALTLDDLNELLG